MKLRSKELRQHRNELNGNEKVDLPAMKRTFARAAIIATLALGTVGTAGCENQNNDNGNGSSSGNPPETTCEIDCRPCLGPGPVEAGSTIGTTFSVDEDGNINQLIRAGNIAANVVCLNRPEAQYYDSAEPESAIWVATVEGCDHNGESVEHPPILVRIGEVVTLEGTLSLQTGTFSHDEYNKGVDGTNVKVRISHGSDSEGECATDCSPCLGNFGETADCGTDERELTFENGDDEQRTVLRAGPVSVEIWLNVDGADQHDSSRGTEEFVVLPRECSFGDVLITTGNVRYVQPGDMIVITTAEGEQGHLTYLTFTETGAGKTARVSFQHVCEQ